MLRLRNCRWRAKTMSSQEGFGSMLVFFSFFNFFFPSRKYLTGTEMKLLLKNWESGYCNGSSLCSEIFVEKSKSFAEILSIWFLVKKFYHGKSFEKSMSWGFLNLMGKGRTCHLWMFHRKLHALPRQLNCHSHCHKYC